MIKDIFTNYLYSTRNKLVFFVFFSTIANASSLINIKKIKISFEINQSLMVILVKGRVTDEDGRAVEGVEVLLKERAKKVKTDVNGYYMISSAINESLEFSIFGFKTKTIRVSKEILDVKLKKI